MKTAFKRAARTFLQLVAGGGLTALVTILTNGLDPQTTAAVLCINTVIVTYVQNLLEDFGWVKPIMK